MLHTVAVMRYLFAILLTSLCFAEEQDIVINLHAQERLAPLFLEVHGNTELAKVLSSDLAHNGHTKLCKTKEEATYIAVFHADRDRFSLTTTHVRSHKSGQVKDLPLNRMQIHRAADAFVSTFFNEPGIASSRILYTLRFKKEGGSGKWLTEVWECDYDGANPKQLTHEGHLCVTPAYLPPTPGKRSHSFLYVSYKVGQPKMYASTAGNEIGHRLSFLKGNQLMPVVSPTHDKIAFISDVTGNPDLFIQDFSLEKGLLGKPRQIFAAPKAAQGCPSFSPDGQKVAFVSNKDGTPRIYALAIPETGAHIDDVKPELISRKNRNNTSPSWSPDGTKIAYSATTKGVRQIWIYDCLTNEEWQLTDGPTHKENPTWAPNSLHLMLNTSSHNRAELYMINLNEKELIRISSGAGEKRFPSWEPLPTTDRGLS